MSAASDNRLQVRLPESYRAWLRAVGGDESAAARKLLAAGAALLGMDGAVPAAIEALGAQLDRETLLWLYDKCTTSVRQAPITAEETEADAGDPLLSIGIEV